MKFNYGPVKIIGGKLKGHIGYYDDEIIENDGETYCYVYLGHVSFSRGYYKIHQSQLANITTDDLISRREKIAHKIGAGSPKMAFKKQTEYLAEVHYIDSLLTDRLFKARFYKKQGGKRLFISRSSLDKIFARYLYVDLVLAGHIPWLDEWDIKAGESIPEEINKALEKCNYMLLVLSDNSIKSNWVKNEWQAKYWDEVNEGKMKVIPILYNVCKIPILLRNKRYADFTKTYNDGLNEILHALSD